MTETRIEAWHFLRPDGRLRDGSEAPADGVVLRHSGPLVLCESGLHASRQALDALDYAPGPIVCRVVLSGRIVEAEDKLVGSERTILWRADATAVLQAFARDEARRVLHLWDAPVVVREYLETGDEVRRDAAWAAAWAAAEVVGWAGAGAAARAAWAAAWAAARAAAWATSEAVWDAVWDAARDAARAAARATARATARDAVRADQEARLTAALLALAPTTDPARAGEEG